MSKEGDEVFNEAYLKDNIKKEKLKEEKFSKELKELQKQKDQVQNEYKTVAYEMKNLEEEILKTTYSLEQLKKQRDKDFPKADQNEVNNEIDTTCNKIFYNHFDTIKNQMDIEVCFEGRQTTFKIDEDKISDFKALKDYAAAFFSLAPEDFFFSDQYDSVILDNLKIKDTLYYYGFNPKSRIPRLNIVLMNKFTFDQVIEDKIAAEIASNDKGPTEAPVDAGFNRLQEEAAMKKARAEIWRQRGESFKKYRGLFSSLFFLVLIILWVLDAFTRFEFKESYTVKQSMDRYLAKVYNQSTPLEFYEKLYSQLRIMKLISSFNNSVLYKQLPVLKDSENKTLQDTYIMLRLFNFWQVGHLILNRFQVEPCKVEDSYTKTLARKCFDATQQDKSPIVVGNRTFEYYTDPNPLSIVGTYNTFDTNGYILPFHLGNKTEHDKSIQYFTRLGDRFSAKSFVIQLAFFAPSLEKIGCVYKTLYQYNYDTVKQEDIVYVLNTRPQSNDALGNSVIAISVLMLLSSASEIIQFVPNNFKDVDPDLVALKEERENPDAPKKKRKKFFSLDVKVLVIKLYPPGSITFMNLVTVILIVWSSSLKISYDRSVATLDFDSNKFFSCNAMLSQMRTINIISCVLIMLLMVALLRYIADLIPILNTFVMMITSLLSNVSSLGIMTVWIFLSLALFAYFNYGSFFHDIFQFPNSYSSLILLVIKKNIIFQNEEDLKNLTNMIQNVGVFPLLWIIVLLYILVTYIIIKIVTAIVIKSIKEAQEKVRSKQGPGGLGNLLGAGGKFLGSLKKKGDKKKGGDKKK